MNPKPLDASSPKEFLPTFLQTPLPETMPELEEQVAVLDQLQQDCTRRIRDFMSREDLDRGIAFPAEIHELRQRKSMLETHKEYRKARVRRLKYEAGQG